MRVRYMRPDRTIVTRIMPSENVPAPGAEIVLEGAPYTVARLILRQGSVSDDTNNDEALVMLVDGKPGAPKRQRRWTRPRT